MNKIINILKRRQFRYGSFALLITAIVIAIAVILNTVISMDAIHSKLKVDLTKNKIYTIGDQTRDLLKELDKKVTIYGLFDESKVSSIEYKQVVEFLNQYQTASNNVNVAYIDPDKNPGFINNELDTENIKDIQKGDFVVKSGNKMRVILIDDMFSFEQQGYSDYYTTGSTAEQALTGAIKYVTAKSTPIVYFTEGHGERKLEEEYTVLKEYLERNNYDAKTLNLIAVEGVPDDAAIVIFTSPKNDISNIEVQKMENYFDKGGEAVFLFDSLPSNPSMSNFEELLSEHNVGLNYDMVIENNQERIINKQIPYDLAPDVQNNEINSNLDPDNFIMIMPKSRSIRILLNQDDRITTYSLMKTSKDAVGQQYAEGAEDILGPLDLAVAVENSKGTETVKVLVMGNGSFMTDSGMQKYEGYSRNGMYFFLNALNWMQDKKDDIIIPQKEFTTPLINMNALISNILALVLIIILPLIILGVGIFVWVRRRHL